MAGGVVTAATWIGLWIYAAVVAGWAARHVWLSLPGPLGWVVEANAQAPAGGAVSVVLPARNERDRIGPCLESLLQQGSAVGEVIVVDDRSDDGTAAAVLTLAGGDPRVRVLSVTDLPAGWWGKAHACQLGADAAAGGWLLFTDADCRFFAGGVAGAVAYARRHHLEFLTLWLRADHRTLWEHLLIPLCGALILYWFPPLAVNRRGRRFGFANGQFLLIERQAYDRIGGHASVAQALLEDIPLAERACANGVRIRAALGSQIAAVRMYGCYRDIRDGWTRIFIGALRRPWKLCWSVWSVLGGSLLPSIGAPAVALWVLFAGWSAHGTLAAAQILVCLHFIAVYTVSYRAWGLCGCDRRYLMLYPVSCVAVIEILVRSWWHLVSRRVIIWRGSVIAAAGGRR